LFVLEINQLAEVGMRRLLLVFLFTVLAVEAISRESFSEQTAVHENGVNNGIGAGGTIYSTWGFIYRRHFANHWGFSTNLGGWFSDHQGHIGNGLGLLYSIAHHAMDWSAMPNASIRVFLSAHLGTIYTLSRDYHYSKVNGKESSIEYKRHYWDMGLGAGPGVEFFFNKYFSLHAELPWMTFIRIEDKSFKFLNSRPNFGGGFVYYF
jgi:hypothetical protein